MGVRGVCQVHRVIFIVVVTIIAMVIFQVLLRGRFPGEYEVIFGVANENNRRIVGCF